MSEETEKAEEAKDKILETLCETCNHREDCLVRREESESAILEAQWYLCHETLGRHSYRPDDEWNSEFMREGGNRR